MTISGEYGPSTRRWVREQVEKYEGSGGTEGITLRGVAVIIVSMLGVRSGKVRKVPLMRVEHGGSYAVVASDGGAERNPVWYHNLHAHPKVEVQDGPVKRELTARELSGEEKAAWWERAVEVWPDYAAYQKKTDRQIPVLVLEPTD